MGACCGGASPPTAAELGGPHGTVLSMLYGEYQANEGSYASAWEVTLEGVRSAAAGVQSGADKDTGTKWRTFARRDLTHVNLYFGLSGTHYVLLATPKDDSAQIHTWCSLVEDYEFNTRASRQHFFDKITLLQTVLDRCGPPQSAADAPAAAGAGAGAKASVDDAKAASAAQHRALLTWPRVEFLIASDGYFDQTRKFSSVWQSRASISSYNDLFAFFTELDGEMEHRKAHPPPAAGTKGAGHKRYLSRSAAPKSALQLARV